MTRHFCIYNIPYIYLNIFHMNIWTTPSRNSMDQNLQDFKPQFFLHRIIKLFWGINWSMRKIRILEKFHSNIYQTSSKNSCFDILWHDIDKNSFALARYLYLWTRSHPIWTSVETNIKSKIIRSILRSIPITKKNTLKTWFWDRYY